MPELRSGTVTDSITMDPIENLEVDRPEVPRPTIEAPQLAAEAAQRVADSTLDELIERARTERNRLLKV